MHLEIPVAVALAGGSIGLDAVAIEGAVGRTGFGFFSFGLLPYFLIKCRSCGTEHQGCLPESWR